MDQYKWQIILGDHRYQSKFKVGDLVKISSDATLNFDTRDIEKNKFGLVVKIRWFSREPLHWASAAAGKIEPVCEVEVLWTPSKIITYEKENKITKV